MQFVTLDFPLMNRMQVLVPPIGAHDAGRSHIANSGVTLTTSGEFAGAAFTIWMILIALYAIW